MRVGDSVRIYENDNFFIEGKIERIAYMEHPYQIRVDWGDFVSYYLAEELMLEHRDGVWSWRPPHEGKVISSKV